MTNNDQIIDVQATEIEWANGDTWDTIELDNRTVTVRDHSWQNPRTKIEKLREFGFSGFTMENGGLYGTNQSGDKGKTRSYKVTHDSLTSTLFSDLISYDNVWLESMGVKNRRRGMLGFGVNVVISAKPEFQDYLTYYLHRYTCGNGMHINMISGRVNLNETALNVDSYAAMLPSGEAPSEQDLLDNLLSESVTVGGKRTYNALNKAVKFFDASLLRDRGKDVKSPMNTTVANVMRPIVNSPQWVIDGMKAQMLHMLDSDDYRERGITTLDTQNIVTNVINHGGKGSTTNKRYYLENNAYSISKALNTYLAFA